MYADIIVDISHEKLDKSFQYRIPDEMIPSLKTGMAVKIPFGKGNREITGYVVGITSKAEFDPEKMKEIRSIERSAQTIEAKLMALAAWIRTQYGSTMNQAIKTVLPVKTRMKEKKKKTIRLIASRRQAGEYLQEARQKSYKGRVRLLEALLESGDGVLDYTQSVKELQVTAPMLKPLVSAGVLAVDSDRVYRGGVADLAGEITGNIQTPNEEQTKVIRGIQEEFTGRKRTCLIRGVTGSGKTLVYMQLIQGMLEEKKQVIVLIPEIALTYQTVRRFYEAFGDQVAVLHSRLTPGERSDQMEQAQAGRVQIMVGPRSALFTPFPDLGLIIIDEEHENSYKSEQMPRYHAREVAIERGRLEDARVVLGSATPSVDSFYQARNGTYALFTMENRFEDRQLPKVELIDLRKELKQGNRSMISDPLAKAMEETLDRQEQMMLFLNRRGYASFVSCRSCGYVAKCPHCDVSMSIHNQGQLICHYCGYETRTFETCPSCGSSFIGGFKAGTQQIEKSVQKMFPQSRILRMDYDSTRKKDGYTKILQAFARKEADILIGTQMIVKGHDFPSVTLVGVLAADLSLNDSDYRSGERTFQLLTQAVGRAGRGEVPGHAFVQTYQPEHYSIRASISQDYEAFYQEEMSYRNMMGYPPAAGMMAILGSYEEEALLENAMKYLRDFVLLLDKKKQFRVIGPAPESVSRIQDVYRQVIYIKHPRREALVILKDKLEEYIQINTGFQHINIQFDFHR